MGNNAQKRVVRTRKQIVKRWKTAKLTAIIGIVILLIGIVVGFVMNRNLYGNVVGRAYKVDAKIIGVHEQMDTSNQDSGSLTTMMYHLTANYDYKGETKEIILNESYLTEAVAKKYIGESRHIIIDTSTFAELTQNPFRYEFFIIVGIGFVVLVGALMFMYRFVNEYKLFGSDNYTK